MRNRNLKNIALIITIILSGILTGAPSIFAQETVSISAGKRGNPFINFTDGKVLTGDAGSLSANGANLALAAASADFDGDGVPDLAMAYKTENGSSVTIRRGNVESIFPPNADAPPEPFFAETQVFELPFAPDYLAAGDFNADGQADLLAAKIGASNLVFRAGTGDGSFAAPKSIALDGNLTALTVGEMNNFDNLADVAVGISEKTQSKILIFQSRYGAFGGKPESVKVRKAVSALAFGELDAHASHDLIAASGDEFIFVSGSVSGKIENKNVSRRKVDFEIKALAVGDVVGTRENEIAVLAKNGELKVWSSDFSRILSTVQMPSEGAAQNFLLAAKVSTRTKTDLITGGANKLNLVTSDGADNLSLAATFDALENPIAVLPIRLNKDALQDLVVLTENKSEPTILMTAATSIITVDTASGTGGGGGTTLFNAIQTANNTPGLQEIQFNLTGNTQIEMAISLPIITEAITINGLSQVHGNGEPMVSLTTRLQTDASTLHIVGGNSVVRGLILNCADAEGNPVRLLTVGNNFVESNFIGTNRTGTDSGETPGAAIRIGDSSANTIGGALPQARNVIAGSTSNGVQINGAAGNNRIKGNFIGTDKTGLVALGNGGNGVLIETGASGNVIGGATDGERNIISGNGLSFSDPGSGVKISLPLNTFSNVVIENNFIGTDKNGAAAFGNVNGGVRFEYNTSVAPTAIAQVFDNVISGNAGDGVYAVNNDVPGEFNAAPEGAIGDILILGRRPSAVGASPEVISPGNRIGTNTAGTAALPNTGNGINLQNIPALVEGNLISGNGENGIKAKPPIQTNLPFEIAGNYIGTDAGGNLNLGNAGDGISLEYSGMVHVEAKSTEIINNVISGNNGDGVKSVGNLTFSNNIANPSGSSNNVMPQTSSFFPSVGRQTQNLSNRVKSKSTNSMPQSMAFFPSIGRQTTNLREQATPGNMPAGNRIGTNAAGTAALPNAGNGVNLQNVPALVKGNLISGNGASGITAKPPISTTLDFEISDNYIGTDVTGNIDLGNTSDGITLEYNGTAHIDAKTSDILSNVISGNNGDGVRIFGNITFGNNIANPSGSNSNAMPRTSTFFVNIGRQTQNLSNRAKSERSNVMPRNLMFLPSVGRQTTNLNRQSAVPGFLQAGNRIGTNADGTAALGNSGHGVSITNIPTIIGGETFADGNIIAHNGLTGVAVFSGAGNLIQSNAIFSNALLNIDLGGDGLTPNDLGDADTGANNLQNYPVLTSASSNGAMTTVSGTINTTPNTDLNIQFYATLIDSSGALNFPPGGGGGPMGMIGLRTDANGNSSFSTTFPVGVAVGRFISATATTADTNVGNENNTSELSPGIAVLAPTSASVTISGKILSPQGAGISRATVTLTAPNGETRTVLTSSFGFYRFTEVSVGETYVISVRAKRYTFAPQVVAVNEEIILDLTAEP